MFGAAIFGFATASAQTDAPVATPKASLSFEPAPRPVNRQPTVRATAAPGGAINATTEDSGSLSTPNPATPAAGPAFPVASAAQTTPYPEAFVPRPNVGSASGESPSNANNILQNFLNSLGGMKGAPPRYLPNGQPNPAFDAYTRRSEGFGGTTYGGDGFVPTIGPEVKNSDYAALCSQINGDPSRYAGHHCSSGDRDRMTCMVCNLYYEANDQPYEGQLTVGRSVLTRLFSGQYAGPNDGVCAVVYRNNGKVAQYSWTFEKWKNHTLPSGAALNRTVAAARASFCGDDKHNAGPNQYTNYFAQSLVNPSWNRSGQCAQPPRTTIAGHTFCRIGGKPTRTVAQVMAAEGVPIASAAAEDSSGASR